MSPDDFNDDPVRAFLAQRGCPDFVIRGGLEGLLKSWERTVSEIEKGYAMGLDDYLNDVDARQLLEEALLVASPSVRAQMRAKLSAVDVRARAQLIAAKNCLWGNEAAKKSGWSADREWWYFGQPKNAGEELKKDLEGR